MSRPIEGPAPAGVFVHRRRVLWGETDAVHIAYTARFLDFAMEATEAWFRERLGAGWYELNLDHGIGTPFVHASLDFRSPLTPRDELAGRADGGRRLVYEASLVCAFVDAAAMRPVRVPDAFRPALEREAALGAAAAAPM